MLGEIHRPWEADEVFRPIYRGVMETNTVVEIERCWELWDLLSQIPHLEGVILEVGCWKGGSGVVLAQAARTFSPDNVVYLCDTFKGTVKGGEIDGEYVRDGCFDDATIANVQSLIFRYNLQNVRVLEGVFPEETSKYITEDKIKFCHIDVDTYQSAKDIYEWVWPRIAVGGILVYDDYGNLPTPGIRIHVDEISKGKDRLFVYNTNEHAILIKRA